MNLHYTSLLTLALALASVSLSAQEVAGCGTETPDGYRLPHQIDPVGYDRATRDFRQARADVPAWGDAAAACADVKQLPLNAVILRRADGTGGLTVAELDAAIATANEKYADACMAFYVSFVTFVDSDRYFDFVTDDEFDLRTDYAVPGALNVYFANSVGNGTGGFFCGYAYYPTNQVGSRSTVLMDNSCTVNGSTFAHELGHAFGLAHTHGPDNTPLATEELVARTNCTTAGDGFCDTPADPQLTRLVDADCNYTGDATDANGDAYVPDPTLLMSYSTKECRTRFSPEQLTAVNFVANNFADRVNLVDPVLQADFDAVADGGRVVCDGGVRVDVTARLKASAAGATVTWDFDGDGVADATGLTAANTYTRPGTYDIALTATLDGETFTTYERDAVIIGAEALPYAQDFEPADSRTIKQRYTFSPTANGRAWRVGYGGTPSGNTGPAGGHDGGLGYVYFEASGGNAAGQEASVTTECIQVPAPADGSEATPTLSFFYHMFGATMGELHVDVETATGVVPDVTPALVGQQQASSAAPYLERTVDLSAFAGQTVNVRFRTVTGADFRGDVAVDAVVVDAAQVPVPVELAAFTAAADGADVALAWETRAERDVSHFAVERAGADGLFAPIAEVTAANAAAGAEYAYRDEAPLAGEGYYRLRAVDFDGSGEVSGVRSVSVAPADLLVSGGDLRAYPNPTTGLLTVEGAPADAEVSVHDYLGRAVATAALAGGRLDLSALAPGVYRVAVRRGPREESLRVVVGR